MRTITDAAIEVLAAQGVKGLTHRAVDTAADLPPGSTSYYLRTREALMEAAVQRLVETDEAGAPSTRRRFRCPRAPPASRSRPPRSPRC